MKITATTFPPHLQTEQMRENTRKLEELHRKVEEDSDKLTPEEMAKALQKIMDKPSVTKGLD